MRNVYSVRFRSLCGLKMEIRIVDVIAEIRIAGIKVLGEFAKRLILLSFTGARLGLFAFSLFLFLLKTFLSFTYFFCFRRFSLWFFLGSICARLLPERPAVGHW